MHFGRVQSDKGLALELPEPRPRTLGYLRLAHQGRRLIYPGAPIWADKDWLGSLYPRGTRPSEYLRRYAQHYAAVECNSIFYQLPSEALVRQWVTQVGPEFRFCPKLPKELSHTLAQGLDRSLLDRYLQLLPAFGEHHGCSFMQLPEHFGPQQGAALESFLRAWSREWPLAIEFRHPGWFSDHMLLDPLINLLYRYKVAAVITDTPGRRDVLHMALTTPHVMVRFQGCFPSSSDDQRLQAWAQRLSEWAAHGLDQMFIFVHQERHAAIPAGIELLIRSLLERQVQGLMLPAQRSRDDEDLERGEEDSLWL